MANPCVKTGARVLVVEYGGVAPADLFLVGNAIVARFGCGNRIELNHDPEATAHATHRLTLGTTGWYRADLGVAVAPIAQLTGELVHPYHGRNLSPAEIAARFARPLVTCLLCEGAGERTLVHPSGNPELEESLQCPECLGTGEVEVDNGVAEALERRSYQRTRAERCLASVLHAHPELRDVLAPVSAAFQETP